MQTFAGSAGPLALSDLDNNFTEAKLNIGTAYNVAGTETVIDFTGIPSWAKRVTVTFAGVSTNGTSEVIIQIGYSGGVETSGYLGSGTNLAASSVLTTTQTTGFSFGAWAAAASVGSGSMTWSLVSASTNTWAGAGVIARSNTTGTGVGAASKALSGTLDRVRVTTVNGTDLFDAGTINILYE